MGDKEYVHLTAELDGKILDVFVSLETFEDSDIKDFFTPMATNIEQQGSYKVEHLSGGDMLPELFLGE